MGADRAAVAAETASLRYPGRKPTDTTHIHEGFLALSCCLILLATSGNLIELGPLSRDTPHGGFSSAGPASAIRA
jgi:hypothetical protein